MALPSNTQQAATHQASTNGVPLLEDEVVLENVHPGWINWWKLLVIAGGLGAFGSMRIALNDVSASFPFVGLALLIAGAVVLSRRRSRYVVTTERVYKKMGLIRRMTSEARITDIHSLSTDETLLERLFSNGTVRIDSTGLSGLLALSGTADHELLANTIRQQQQYLAE